MTTSSYSVGTTKILGDQTVNRAGSASISPAGELADLIQTHREAFKQSEDACLGIDVVILKREPTPEEQEIWDNAEFAETDAIIRICGYRPATTEEEKAKGAYLLSYMKTGGYREDIIVALLKSMAGEAGDERGESS